jgi:hypothetical protein
VRDFDHKAEVGLDHLLSSLFVPFLDPRGQFDFLLGREQLHLPNLPKVKLYSRIPIVPTAFALNGMSGWGRPIVPRWRSFAGQTGQNHFRTVDLRLFVG